jgi:hypothetical protein
MSPDRFLLGGFAYRPRHAQPGVRWPQPALLLTTTVALLTTSMHAAAVILAASAVLAALASLVRGRLVSAATRIDRILTEELGTDSRPRRRDGNSASEGAPPEAGRHR